MLPLSLTTTTYKMDNVRSLSKSSKVRDLVDEITVAVETDCDQNPAAHARLLTAIQKLQTAVETPLESMLRFLFFVCGPAPKIP